MKKYPSNISIEVTQEKGYILPKGYSWDVKMVKGMKEGKVTVKDKMKLVHAVLFYSHDKLNGICSFYDKGRLLEKRTYVDNVANGWACEYEKSKEVRWFIYKNGKKENILGKCEEKDGYWKETCIDSHSLITVCQYNKNHKKNGICYLFNGKSILKAIRYENDVEKGCLKEFKDNQMTEYDTEGNVVYKGEYKDCLNKDYPRHGEGNELKEGECIYYGDWKNNKKEGFGCSVVNGIVYYEGDWSENVPDGEGVLNNMDGEMRYEGKWENGLCHIKENDWFDYVTNKIIKKSDDSKPLVLESVELEKMSTASRKDLISLLKDKEKKKLVSELVIEEGCGNDWTIDLNLCGFENLKKLVIKKNSLKNLNSLKISNNKELEIIKVEGSEGEQKYNIQNSGACCSVKNITIESILL